MIPICRRILFSFSGSSSSHTILVSHFSTSPLSSSRRHDEESRNVRVSVWWDFENCHLPAGVNVFKVAQTITSAIRANGIKGPITITAYGDVLQLSRANQEALSCTGINISHVPNGGKNSADQSLLVDLMCWVSQNPPPAHIFLISGDRDFASVLHRLRMNNYNILLATTDCASNILRSAASIMWYWNSLVRGENLNGKHYNQPPDGPYGSWYGHYKAPIEDPFSAAEPPPPPPPPLPVSSSNAISFSDSVSDSRIRQVPKTVMKQIRHILSSYPNGLSIGDLRAELTRTNVGIDKDLYGYKKFSRFLLSMPHILKLRPEGDGRFTVRGVSPKAPQPFDSFLDTSNGEDKCKDGSHQTDDCKPTSPISPESSLKELPKKVEDSPTSSEKVVYLDHSRTVQQLPTIEKNVLQPPGAQKAEVYLPPVGFFKKIWQKWFSGSDKGSEVKSHDVLRKCMDSGNLPKDISHETPEKSSINYSVRNIKIKDKSLESSNQNVEKIKNVTSADTLNLKSDVKPAFLNQARNWFKFGSSKPESDPLSDQFSERPDLATSNPQKHETLLKESFWSEMESFINSPRASVIVAESRTREQMAQSLQKEGPLALRDISENDLLNLVGILISEKKWVKECSSETSPFKLTWEDGSKSSFDHNTHSTKEKHYLPDHNTCSTNGLRSIFLNMPEHKGERKIQNITHAGVSTPTITKMHLDRSRCDILADCQKLVNEVLKMHPEGYNIGSFRRMFLEKYGYHLDLKKLGYEKLASLLEIMPGVKIESTYMYSSTKVQDVSSMKASFRTVQEGNDSPRLAGNSDSESEAPKKNDDSDSSWDELGPLSNLSFDTKERQSVPKREKYSCYEPSASDDEFSDSEVEVSEETQAERKEKPGMNEEDSSLLQILDSWYSSKESDNRKDKPENADGMVDCSTTAGDRSSETCEFAYKSETSLENFPRKQKPQKSYSFVSDPVESSKEKLIDGILGSLKKSGESRMQS